MTTTGDWNRILTDVPGGARLQVKVTPGAAKTKLIGPHGDCLKIAVAAPPEKGKANQELIRFLANVLNLPKRQMAVAAGETSHRKTIRIEGTGAETCRAAMQAKLDP